MNLKSVLKISSLVMVLGLIFLTPLQTYADFINTVDNEVTEILKENESEESDETDTYDDVELEREQYPDLELDDELFDTEILELDDESFDTEILELDDESFDTEILEEDVESVEDDASEEDSVEAMKMSNAIVVLVSNETELRDAINNAPTNGTLRIVEADRNFNLVGVIQIPARTNIMLRSNNVNQNRTITSIGFGRHININSNAVFTLGDGIILTAGNPNTANTLGGVEGQNNAEFRMIGGEISGNTSRDRGGAVEIRGVGTFTMEGGKISDNKANGNGGGVYVWGTFTMKGGEISGNTSTRDGGGVYVTGTAGRNDGFFTMKGGEISDNKATRNGGGVIMWGTFTMEDDGEISGNTAGHNGGGVNVASTGTFTMEGGEISDNKATGNGGGISGINGSTFNMESGQISANTASGDGGGISLVGANTSVDLSGPNIEIFDNKSERFGGGVAADNVSNVRLNNIQIFNNEALYGGGMYLTDINRMTLNHNVITKNDAVKGGGMYVDGNIGALVIDGGEITSNQADVVGGIYVSYAEGIDNVSISRNTYVAGNMTTTNILLFDNLYNERHNINANGRINPLPWDGLDGSHVFNTVDVNTSGFEVVVRLKYNFEGSDATTFKQIEFNVTDFVEFSSQFWDEYIADNIPVREGYTFSGWSFTPEGEIIDNTQLDYGFILEDLDLYAQWEPDPTYLNVSIPTAVFFQSNHVDATQLESQRYTITNNSIMGVHVDVANFEATSATGIDLIEELNVHSTAIGSASTRLITNGSIETIPTNSRLLALPGSTNGSFEFSGQTNISSQVENPSFNLILSFQVADVTPETAQ